MTRRKMVLNIYEMISLRNSATHGLEGRREEERRRGGRGVAVLPIFAAMELQGTDRYEFFIFDERGRVFGFSHSRTGMNLPLLPFFHTSPCSHEWCDVSKDALETIERTPYALRCVCVCTHDDPSPPSLHLFGVQASNHQRPLSPTTPINI